MKRIGGLRRKTRGKFRKDKKDKGKISLRAFFQTFKPGDIVHLTVEPAIHKGLYHPRFIGKTGVVTGKTGRCYEVKINDFKKEKTVIVHPVHLKGAK